MRQLDRASPLPLWAQLADDLRRRVADGSFTGRLPSEAELVAEYDVSRNTVREAMRRLGEAGLVRRQRGRGTTIVDVGIERSLPGHYSLARTIEGQGLEERSEVLALDLREAGEAAGPLELAAGAEAVYLERVRYAGDEPLALDRSWLPAAVARRLLGVDLTRGSLYDALLQHCRCRVNGGWERITPVNPPAGDRSRLRLPRRVAAFSVERLSRADGSPVEWRCSVVRGDRYRFVSTWP
ncbi:MAG TPA: GntR family transcriptional regulator [Acidimicrobiales bacterium]|nr:GntR family transcriptional regulator [Acidimicrobiales bacterium]